MSEFNKPGQEWAFYGVVCSLKSHLQVTMCVLSPQGSEIRVTVILTFESLDEILKCDHSNESY